MTFTVYQLVVLLCATAGMGAIGIGFPAGYWVRGLPVPGAPARDAELGEVADLLDEAAAIIRDRATTPPPR